MPRYFFTVTGERHPDREGLVLDSAEKARSEAVLAAGGMLQDLDGRFWQGAQWRMEVTDEQGRPVCVLTISGRSGDP